MRAEEKAGAAPDDSGSSLVQRPGETESRSKVDCIRVIRFLRVAIRPKIHFSQIRRRFQIDDLRGPARLCVNSYGRIVVVTQAQVEYEPLVRAPVVLDEASEFVQVPVVGRLAVIEAHRVRNVR